MNTASEFRLAEIHPDLSAIIHAAAGLYLGRFEVVEGVRSLGKQKKLFAAGASKTMRSRHIPECNRCGKACAVDLAVIIDNAVRWDWPLYGALADTVKEASKQTGIPIEWGGDWRTFKDGPHFQLPWSKYP